VQYIINIARDHIGMTYLIQKITILFLMGERIAREHNIRNTIAFPNHRAEPLFLAEIGALIFKWAL
jgi:hypothetical protein